jgi:hypothetical protein
MYNEQLVVQEVLETIFMEGSYDSWFLLPSVVDLYQSTVAADISLLSSLSSSHSFTFIFIYSFIFCSTICHRALDVSRTK